MANDRISQLPVEVIVDPTSAKARFSQVPVEVIVDPTSAKARVSSVIVEVIISPVVIPYRPLRNVHGAGARYS